MASKSIGLLNIVFGADLRGFEKAMKKAQRSIKKFGSSMKRTGANMTRNITMPVIALGAVAVKTFADFEQSMLKVKAISGATGQEFNALRNKAKELGASTMFTASQVAELQLNLSKLGLTPKEINKSTESILNLAQATDSDLAQAATVAASTMKGFGLESKDMNRIADVMADSFSSTALDMEKFQVAMATVAPVANQAGASLEETTAVLGVLTNRGVEASTAGTSLRNVYLELANKGITWAEAMDQIKNSTNPLKDAMELFGKRGATVATIIANNRDEITELTADFKDSKGEAKDMAAIMDSGVGGAMRRLKSQAEGVAIELGGALIPLFQKLLNGVKSLLEWWSGLDGSMQNSIIAFGLLAGALGPMVGLMGTLAVAFSALVSPIGLTVAAIIGIVVAFAYVRENWDAFKERLSDWNWWKNALIQALQWMIEFNPISIMIKSVNALIKFMGGTEIPNPFESTADALEDLKVETKEYENEFGSFKDAMVNQGKEVLDMFKKLGKGMGVGGGGFSTSGGGGDDTETTDAPIIGSTDEAFATYKDYLASISTETGKTTKSLGESWGDFFDVWGDKINKAVEKVKTIMSSVSGVISAVNEKENAEFNEMRDEKNEKLDEDYESNLERIQNSVMSEEEKNAAIAALDETFAGKKTALDEQMDKKEKAIKRKQAIRNKGMGIMNAIISTIEGVMGAVAALPATGGLPMSAIIAGLGAAQVAAIASTPIPFAQGGLVSGPTLGLIGEGAGTSAMNPEVVAPLDKLIGMMGTSNVNVHGRIQGNNIVLVSDKAEISRQRFI